MITKSDKRRHPRVKIAPDVPEVQLHLFSHGGATETRRVRALDLSRSGMSFQNSNPVEADTRCTILINHRQRPLRIIGKVVSSHPGAGGVTGFVIGVKFTSLTPISSDGLTIPLCDDPAIDRLLIEVD